MGETALGARKRDMESLGDIMEYGGEQTCGYMEYPRYPDTRVLLDRISFLVGGLYRLGGQLEGILYTAEPIRKKEITREN